MITVLLADDHRMVRDGLRYLLEAPGDIQIAALASNGREAVERAIALCPDVAVIDVSMPVMDGIEATRYICENCPDTHVVMLSMYDTPEYVHRALRAGAAGYVLKDEAGSELVEAVRSLYNGGNYYSPKIAEIVKNLR
ncbi:MAG TPA: response regulator transcription factor [Anaerolineales bacterium]|nr:response regulator transcription factor [Anaerolineales bacterium]